MNTFAILIDAGFVKTRLGSADNPTTAEDIRALVQRICKHHPGRAVFVSSVFLRCPAICKNQAGAAGSVCLVVFDGPRDRFVYSREVSLEMIRLAHERLDTLEKALLEDQDG